MNIALIAACLPEKQDEAAEHLRSILKVMDVLVSGSRITYATRHESRMLRDIPQHFHESEYQVEYFVKGDGTIRCGNRWMIFFPGSLCFIPPGITHEIIYPRSSNMDNYSIKFKIGNNSCLLAPTDAFVVGVPAPQQPVLLSLLKTIVGNYVQDIPVSPEKMYSMVRLINEIRTLSLDKPEENDIVSRVKKIVNANVSSELRITDIAWQLDLSHEYVSRMFRKHTGQTLTSYINSQRLKSSLILLKNTDIPFKQIAVECGFSSVNYFHTVFKKYLSISPRHIRNTRGDGNQI
jgi:AraC-like DNA-binding protein/mannose-6-phosphate isomerase-like protein (cupin superfamily)